MDYFKDLSFTESLEVYNCLEKKMSNEVDKEFVIDVLKGVLGSKETKSQAQPTPKSKTKLDSAIDNYF